MALSGTITGNILSGKYVLRIEWSATQSIANNQSTISTTQYLDIAPYYSLYISSRTNDMNIGGNTSQYSSSAISYDGSSSIATKSIKLGTGSATITHNDDGTKSINISSAFYIKATLNNQYFESISASGDITLDTIPRASSVSAGSGNIGESITITIDKKATAFTSTLTYWFGNLKGTIKEKTTATSVGFTLPETFYAQIPNSSYGSGTIYCTTYNGDTKIGDTQQCDFTAYVSEAKCKPDVTISAVDNNKTLGTGYTTTGLTGSNKTIIKYISDVQVTSSYTTKNSATISSSYVTCGDGRGSGGSSPVFTNVQSNVFTQVAIDSRGFKNTATASGLTLLDYYIPKITQIDVSRESQVSSNIYLKLSAECWANSFGKETNYLYVSYKYRTAGSSTWSDEKVLYKFSDAKTKISGYSAKIETECDYKTAYEFLIIVADKAYLSNTSFAISKGIPVWSEGESDLTVHDDFIMKGDVYENSNKITINKEKYFFYSKFSMSSITTDNWIELPFESSVVDELNCFDSSTKKYKVPIDGYYRLTIDFRLDDILSTQNGNSCATVSVKTPSATEPEIYNSQFADWDSQFMRITNHFDKILKFTKDSLICPVAYIDSTNNRTDSHSIKYGHFYCELIKAT